MDLHDNLKKKKITFENKIILNEFTQINNWQTVSHANSFVSVFLLLLFFCDLIISLCFKVDLNAQFFF